MKRIWIIVLGLMLFVGSFDFSFAAEGGGSAEEAKGMIEAAVAFLNANGKDKTLAELNNGAGKFVKGEVYVVSMAFPDGTILAHPYNQKLVGKNFNNVPDPDGKFFRKDIMELANAKGEGWVDFKYKNPVNNKIESKTAFIKKAEDMVLVCGTYKH